MDCFEAFKVLPEIWDEKDSGKKKALELHLKSCSKCRKQVEHFDFIKQIARELPRHTLPSAWSKHPMDVGKWDPPAESGLRKRIRGWATAPWYIRNSLETLVFTFAILAVILGTWQVQKLYQKRFDHRFDAFHFVGDGKSFSEPATADWSSLLGGGSTQNLTENVAEADSSSDGESSPPDEAGSSNAREVLSKGPLTARNSEIWRFYVKTDSPPEMRSKVIRALGSFDFQKQGQDLNGIEAPGGIQFNFLVPVAIVPQLKTTIEEIASDEGVEAQSHDSRDAFTWYKKKSAKTIEKGFAQVVIWLSQM